MRGQIVDQRLQVVGALLQFPQFLIAARLVVEYADYEVPVDILAATGHILQDLFGLAEIDKGVFWVVV